MGVKSYKVAREGNKVGREEITWRGKRITKVKKGIWKKGMGRKNRGKGKNKGEKGIK